MLDGVPHHVGGNDPGIAHIHAQHDDVQHLGVTQFQSQLRHGSLHHLHILAGDLVGDDGAVDVQGAALLQLIEELIQAGAVHDDQVVHHVAQRRADLLIGDDHIAVGRAAPLLRAVGGEEGHVLVGGVTGGLRQKFAQGHHALTAEAGYH